MAFEFAAEELGESALFPHITSKNLSFRVNFGQLEKNLLTDLKPKAKKKVVKVEEVAPVAASTVVEKTEEESIEKSETTEEAKQEQELAADEAAVEKKSDEAETVAEPEEAVNTETAEPVAAVEGAENDVEMKEEAVDEKPADTVEPAEEVKQDTVEEAAKESSTEEEKVTEENKEEVVEEEEPLPEIHRENLPGYIFIGLAEKEALVAGPVRPESRKECEVIMMIGLSGAGKTKWVNDWVAANTDKRYVVLGASALIARMKVSFLRVIQ